MSTEPMTLDADWIATMDGPMTPRGRVIIDSDRIAAVGPAADIPVRGQHHRLDQSVLLPGLINAHCHLELSAWHGAFPPGDLWSWLPRLVMQRLLPGAAAKEQAAVASAVRSMVAAGTTCVGDISRAAWLPAALASELIRKVCYIELISEAASPPANMPQLQQRLADLPRDPLLTAGISPHAPYTVTRDDLQACAALAARDQLPLAIHLAETREEIEWLRHGTGPISQWHAKLFKNPPQSPLCGPTEYALAARLAEAPAAALIHMNHADDWRLLCATPENRRPVVVYCPRSHAFFGHPAHPFRQMLAAGIPIAIGTDSAASHCADEPRPLSVLDELRWLRAHCPDVSPETLVRMATRHAACALGLGNSLGCIRAGFRADLVAFNLARPDAHPLADLLDAGQQPRLVCIAGQLIP